MTLRESIKKDLTLKDKELSRSRIGQVLQCVSFIHCLMMKQTLTKFKGDNITLDDYLQTFTGFNPIVVMTEVNFHAFVDWTLNQNKDAYCSEDDESFSSLFPGYWIRAFNDWVEKGQP